MLWQSGVHQQRMSHDCWALLILTLACQLGGWCKDWSWRWQQVEGQFLSFPFPVRRPLSACGSDPAAGSGRQVLTASRRHSSCLNHLRGRQLFTCGLYSDLNVRHHSPQSQSGWSPSTARGPLHLGPGETMEGKKNCQNEVIYINIHTVYSPSQWIWCFHPSSGGWVWLHPSYDPGCYHLLLRSVHWGPVSLCTDDIHTQMKLSLSNAGILQNK